MKAVKLSLPRQALETLVRMSKLVQKSTYLGTDSLLLRIGKTRVPETDLDKIEASPIFAQENILLLLHLTGNMVVLVLYDIFQFIYGRMCHWVIVTEKQETDLKGDFPWTIVGNGKIYVYDWSISPFQSNRRAIDVDFAYSSYLLKYMFRPTIHKTKSRGW